MKLTRVRVGAGVLVLSAAGLINIALEEGYVGRVYDDVVGVATWGFGTTDAPDGPVTVTRALVKLGEDTESYQETMRECVGDVPLYSYEWDAYVSLAYNIGPGAFCRSTLVRKLQEEPPDYVGACAKILDYKRGGPWYWGVVNSTGEEYYYPLTTSGKQQAKSKLSGLALSEPASGWRIKKTKRIIKGLLIRRQREYKTCMGVEQ